MYNFNYIINNTLSETIKINNIEELNILQKALISVTMENERMKKFLYDFLRIKKTENIKFPVIMCFDMLNKKINVAADIDIFYDVKSISDFYQARYKKEFKEGDTILHKNIANVCKIMERGIDGYCSIQDCITGCNYTMTSEDYFLGQATPISELYSKIELDVLGQEYEANKNKFINSLQKDIVSYKQTIKNSKELIAQFEYEIQNCEEQIKKIEENKINDEKIKSISDEITKIQKHNLCNDVVVSEGEINILTKQLYITEPYTNKKYYLGEMLFSIPFDKKLSIKFLNINNSRQGYGKKIMHHPHIFPDGTACFGTAGGQVAYLMNNEEYMALYLTLIAFCQTVDIDDEAGRYVSQWDEVDEDENVICKGHAPTADEYNGHGYCPDDEYFICTICREENYIGDVRTCEICGNEVCPDCWDSDLEMCCDCATEFDWCDCCGAVVRISDMTHLSEGGYVCDFCTENLEAIECQCCEKVFLREDLIYDEESGLYYCKECYEEKE